MGAQITETQCHTGDVPLLFVSIVMLNLHCPNSTIGRLKFMKSLLALGIGSSAISQLDIS